MGRHGSLNVYQVGIRWQKWGERTPNSYLFDSLPMLTQIYNVIWWYWPKWINMNKSVLVQVKAWHWAGDKPLPDPMLTYTYNAICCHWLKWVNTEQINYWYVTKTQISKWHLQSVSPYLRLHWVNSMSAGESARDKAHQHWSASSNGLLLEGSIVDFLPLMSFGIHPETISHLCTIKPLI